MNAVVEKKKVKRPSHGIRAYNRKVKQEGRKEGLSETEIKKKLLKS